MLNKPRRRIFSFLLTILFAVACAFHAFAQNPTAFPGANGRIAFVSLRDRNAEIYTANPDGTNQTRLTDTPAQELMPAWSPDGTRIAFTSVTANRTTDSTSVNATADIYIINADGSGLRRLTNNSAYNTAPTWSPDGTRIAFSRSTINPQILMGGKPGVGDLLSASADIYVIGADGSNETNLTRSPLAFEFLPAWSPDGGRIAYTNVQPVFTFDGKVSASSDIFVMNSSGGNQRQLFPAETLIDSRIYYFAPSWSPSGARVAFTGVDVPSVNPSSTSVQSRIYIVNADGTNKRTLSVVSPTRPLAGYDALPSWSPDGTKITFTGATFGAYARREAADVGVFVVNADGNSLDTSTTRLTRLSNVDFDSDWGSAPASVVSATNKLDDAREFVRQQYLDFLDREPDAPGWDFWTREITECADAARRRAGETEERCVDRKRVNTSGAFFLSDEYQATGYYVYRLNKGVLGNNATGNLRYADFLADQRAAKRDIVVNDRLSPEAIERNKQTLAEDFLKRAKLDALSNEAFVDYLFSNTGVTPTADERRALVEGLATNAETRASVARKIVDGTRISIGTDGRIAQEFTTSYGRRFYEAEFNRAFVLMQYFGYLRREPDRDGYDFWLAKLDRFGNFIDAEMVRSFILATEYRSRFGHP